MRGYLKDSVISCGFSLPEEIVPKSQCKPMMVTHGFIHLYACMYVYYGFLYILMKDQTEQADHLSSSA